MTIKKLHSGYWHVRFGPNQFVQWPHGAVRLLGVEGRMATRKTATELLEDLKLGFAQAMSAYVEHLGSLGPNRIPAASTRAHVKALVDHHLKSMATVETEVKRILKHHIN